ncbi:MAG: 4Fe-4S dicluster domain-containing protein [Nitrospirae bacterium]|nr:4Fe-4S dicluster domain-containing protein [Nitrospirota bacterium]MCL5978481.1 4Fe-4S dicluster domain-containing protein [Nitrospirota bacterium]
MITKSEVEQEKKVVKKALPWVIPAQCEGCTDCVNACPVHGLEMWETENEGVFIPWLSNPDACIGCGKCEKACTWGAISLTSYVDDARQRFLTKKPLGLIAHDEKRKFNLRDAASKKVAMILCMDCRLNLENILQQNKDNAYILRNAGLLIDDSELRALVFSTRVFGIEEIFIIGHRDCRIREANVRLIVDELDEKLQGKMEKKDIRSLIKNFKDPEANLKKQAEVIRQSKLIPENIPISGIMYEEFTGDIFKIF